MGSKKIKDQEKIDALNNKFSDIKAIREKILGQSGEVATKLKNYYKQRKAVSPEKMTQNLKSISSFLENFTRMVKNINSKVDAITEQIKDVDEKQKKIKSITNSL
ncbi:MAG: hypothetical protein ACOC44_00805 [Promethearchaeia archaeon]